MEKKYKGRVAFITGISGMDGSHLADFLLDKGYKVFGMERRTSSKNRVNTRHLEGSVTFLQGDLTDQNSLFRCLKHCNPDEVYNLASQSFVGESWNTPLQTSDVTGLGVLRILEAIREYNQDIKFYQASSSEMFGNTKTDSELTQYALNEKSEFSPRSPYGVAKLFGHEITKNYRESYNMFACSGILFNHESERRGIEFVTRKISDGVARISMGLSDKITLGNIDSYRDWGYAPDYVRAMWLMLQHDEPDDFVIATCKEHSIRDFLRIAFEYAGYEIEWQGIGLEEIAIDIETGRTVVDISPKYFRPADIKVLRGDYSKAKEILHWQPTVDFRKIVERMTENDLMLLEHHFNRKF